MKKIVIASDSFKGSLTSVQAAEAITRGIKDVCPNCETVEMAVADGGEGTAAAILRAQGGIFVTARTHDPLMRETGAEYGITADGGTAIIDTAAASGFALLAVKERDPMAATTFGTGELILDAVRRGCRRVILGTGGSATNDAGTGILRALGYRFPDENGKDTAQGGGSLCKIASVDASGKAPEIPGVEFVVAYDVSAPFCGPDGAAYVYGPQKGADEKSVFQLDGGMERFADVLERTCGIDVRNIPGSGSAGGTAGTLHAVLGAELIPGAQLVLDIAGFRDALRGACLVITGEGRADRQTLSGKVPGEILKTAAQAGVPSIIIAGSIEDAAFLRSAGFAGVYDINEGYIGGDPISPDVARRNIRNTVGRIMREWI